ERRAAFPGRNIMMTAAARRVLLALVSMLLLDVAPSLASDEPFAVFEDWGDAVIRFERWAFGRTDDALEVRREIQGHQLRMRYRRQGLRGGLDTSFLDVSNRLFPVNSSAITQWEVDFTVRRLTVI